MHDVSELFWDISCQTKIWISAAARKGIADYHQKKRVMMLLERFATRGFQNFEGPKRPIAPEWDGVYRFNPGTLFRITGFYEGGSRTSFIAIDAMLKRQTKLSSAERRRIDEVARVRKENDWRKVYDHYPRPAQYP
jgi:hypothetical protein